MNQLLSNLSEEQVTRISRLTWWKEYESKLVPANWFSKEWEVFELLTTISTDALAQKISWVYGWTWFWDNGYKKYVELIRKYLRKFNRKKIKPYKNESWRLSQRNKDELVNYSIEKSENKTINKDIVIKDSNSYNITHSYEDAIEKIVRKSWNRNILFDWILNLKKLKFWLLIKKNKHCLFVQLVADQAHDVADPLRKPLQQLELEVKGYYSHDPYTPMTKEIVIEMLQELHDILCNQYSLKTTTFSKRKFAKWKDPESNLTLN